MISSRVVCPPVVSHVGEVRPWGRRDFCTPASLWYRRSVSLAARIPLVNSSINPLGFFISLTNMSVTCAWLLQTRVIIGFRAFQWRKGLVSVQKIQVQVQVWFMQVQRIRLWKFVNGWCWKQWSNFLQRNLFGRISDSHRCFKILSSCKLCNFDVGRNLVVKTISSTLLSSCYFLYVLFFWSNKGKKR